jgi:hypothetical protein
MGHRTGFIRTSNSAATVYLGVRFKWAVTTMHGRIMVVIVMVMKVLPRHLAVVVGISSSDMAHLTAAVAVLKHVIRVIGWYVRLRRVETVPSWKDVNPEISSLRSVF